MVVQILSPVLIVLGLSLPESGSVAWMNYLLWALFATAASLVQLVTLRGAPLHDQRSEGAPSTTPNQRWSLAAVATAALVGYWVIIVLPGISANSAFLQTLGVGCAAVGLWLAPGRRV